MTTHPIIYAWGDFGPDSVTGRWGANTYHNEAVAYVPQDLSDARVAAAYGYIADLIDVTCDLTSTAGYTDFAERMREMVPGIRDAAPADAIAAFEATLKQARNEALEEAAQACDMFAEIHLSAATDGYDDGHSDGAAKSADAIRSMKEDV